MLWSEKCKFVLGRGKNLSIKAPTPGAEASGKSTMIPSSSVVEQAAVNRLAGGSNPPWGANPESPDPNSQGFLRFGIPIKPA